MLINKNASGKQEIYWIDLNTSFTYYIKIEFILLKTNKIINNSYKTPNPVTKYNCRKHKNIAFDPNAFLQNDFLKLKLFKMHYRKSF